jgi:hypothetical protein
MNTLKRNPQQKAMLMKFNMVFTICLCAPLFIFAYTENSLPDLSVPTQLAGNSLEAIIAHRFVRDPKADFPDNFIQLANVNLGFRYIPFKGFEAGLAYLTYTPVHEYDLNAAYSLLLPAIFLRTKAALQFYGAQNPANAKWDNNFFYQIDLQTEPVLSFLLPVVDIAYDPRSAKTGLGMGIDLVLSESLDLLGEYYPLLGKKELLPGGAIPVNCYLMGLKITTAGHQFMLTVTNNYDMGMRHHMAGAPANVPYFGFNIQRLFSF